MATQWSALKHKSSPERRERLKKEALAEYAAARSGMARLRLYRDETQLNVASRMNVPQSVVSRWERGDNPQIRTVQRYIEALGGKLQMTAVFPEDSVDLGQLFAAPRLETPANTERSHVQKALHNTAPDQIRPSGTIELRASKSLRTSSVSARRNRRTML